MATLGESKLTVTLSGGIQSSNYGANSFWVENTGEKSIAKVEIDVTSAMFPDTVFDPFGLAGDTAFKKLTINTDGATGIVTPSNDTSYIGAGGIAGYEAIQLIFDSNVNGGFQSGEALGFSIDMDPNSIAGSSKSTLDAGSDPAWDVGGVSGAELIGSLYTVTFTDGSTAQGQLQGVKDSTTTNSQGGAQALATQAESTGTVELAVAGLTPGGADIYSDAPEVIVSGPAGETARIVLAKGFVQPASNLFEGTYATQFDAQIADLYASAFPANNAVEFQVVDILLTGEPQDISASFDFAGVAVNGVPNEARLPLGFVASLIDPANGDLPAGPVTAPIYLRPTNVAPVAADDTGSTTAGTAVTLSVLADDTDTDGDALRLWSTTQGSNGSIVANPDGTLTYTPDAGYTGTDSFTYTAADGQGGEDIASVTVEVAPDSGSGGSTPVLGVNAGGAAYTTADGVAYGADQYFSGGKTNSTTASIINTDDDALYQTERWQKGGFSYAMPVADGTYTVTLSFAEIYFDAAGKRVFDVAAEGDLVLDNLDIWTAAGGKNIALDVPITVTVTDGTLNLDFVKGTENPKVSAILVETASTGGNTAPVAGDDTVTLDEDTAAIVSVLSNDSDADGDTLAIASVTQGANGSVVNNGDGTLTYTPETNFNGSDSFTYTVADGQGGTDTASVAVTVAPVNDDPVAADDTGSTAADTAVTLSVLANDTDVDGDPLTIASVTQGSNGSVVANPDGTLTYTPDAGYTGTDSFTYTAADGQGGEDIASVTVEVALENAAPVAGDDTVTLDEDTAAIVSVLSNDSDADGDTLAIASVTQGANGSVVNNGDGTLTYTPETNFNGSDSFTYTVADGQGGTDTASVAVTVAPVNDDPVAADDTGSTAADTAVTLSVLANDTDVDGDPLTIASVTQGSNGSIVANPDGTLTYTPDAGYTGTDSFTYTAADGQGGEDIASVTVEVAPDSGSGGSTPVLGVNAGGAAYTTADGVAYGADQYFSGGKTNSTTASIINTDDDALYQTERWQKGGFSYAMPVADGTYTVTLSFAEIYFDAAGKRVFDVAAEGDLVLDNLDIWTAAGGKNIALDVPITVTVTDGTLNLDFVKGTENPKVSAILVETASTGGNTAPVAGDDTVTLDEDTAAIVSVLSNDSDADGDTLAIASVTQGANGSVVNNGDGTLTYTPETNFNGSDSFTYTVADGQGGTDTASVAVTVAPVNDDPVAADDTGSTAADTAVTLSVLANDTDVDGDPLTIASVTQGSNGSIVANPDGTLTYTPDAGYTGTDSFTYTAADGQGGEDIASVTVEVALENAAPVAGDDTVTLDEDTAAIVSVLSNDSDADGDTLAIASVTQGANGSVVNNGDGTLTYTPETNFNGSDSFTYTVADGQGGTDTASVAVTVAPVNDDPVAADDTGSTAADTAVTLSVLANDTDVDGDPLTIASVTQGSNGSIVANPDGTLTYTPDAGYTGTDSFTYTAADGQGGEDIASVTVEVALENAAPVAGDDTVTLDEDTAAIVSVLSNDSDADGDTLAIASVTQGANGSVVNNGDGTLTYTPETNFNGSDSFTYTVADGQGGTDTASVAVTVAPVNDDPVAADDTGSTAADTAVTLSVLANDTDVDGDPLTIASVTQGSNGSIVANPDGTLTYTPDAGYTGTDSFTYTAADGQGGEDIASVTVEVALENAAPVAGDDTVTLDEDTAAIVSVLSNDSDADGDTLAIASVTQGANGSVVNNGDGTLTYTPETNFNGSDSFTYTVADGQGGTDTASVAVTVAPVNDDPVAADDTGSTAADTAVTLSVLANDTDVDGDPLTIASVTQGSNGSIVANPDGTLTYTPDAGYTGTDSFTYTAADGQGGEDIASVTVEVAPDSGSGGSTPVLGVNAGGAAYTTADGVAYGADQYFSGGKTNSTTASIINTDDDALYQTERWQKGGFSYAMPVADGTYTVTLSFAEIYLDAAGQRVFDVAAEGNVVLDNLDIWATAGGKNVALDVPITVTVTDGTLNLDFIKGTENPKVSAILVESAGGNSVDARADSATTSTDQSVTIDVLANDIDPEGDPLQITGTTMPSNGAVAMDDRGTVDPTDDQIIYTPNAGFSGTDTFTYSISDGNGGSDSATVTVEVMSPDAVAFSTIPLTGIPDKSYTSLQFGPDGRLYASHRFGEIYAFDIEQQVDSSGKIVGYAATSVETISLIKSIPNHNDDGTLNSNVTTRQVTGIVVAGTEENPVLYVGSSDPREGGGSGGGKGDTGLDTNSGIISRLTWTGSGWEKIDLVRGLPRSEENHSTNGLALTTDPETGGRVLLVAQGGHTNAGAPSTNFAYSTEYALSAAILAIDLDTIESGVADYAVKTDGAHQYVYDLPTVQGPVFGGQDGLNQARLVADGPVSVYSSGYRNPYDLVVTEAGDLFTIDNGANKGWGGLPDGEGTAAATNRIPTDDPDGFNSVNNLDHLEFVAYEGYYAGHPNPIRANPDGAGLLYTGPSGAEVWTQTPDGTWPPVDPALSFPEDGDFRLPGVEDDALVTWGASTNGLDEYTASNFGGSLKGDLITAAFDSSIYRISLDATNGSATKEAIASGLNGIPLDVTAQGDFDPFPGTIWIGYVAGSADIEVLVPTIIDGTADDLDGDGYSNDDELANGTNPNSPSSIPPDNDGDLTSDLNDADDDNDTLADPADHFAIDAANGTMLTVTGSAGFFNPLRNDDPGVGFSGLGFTGWMNNGTTDYLDQYDDDNLIAGGTSGIFSIVQTTSGDARGSLNTQDNGFQFGIANDLSGSTYDNFLVNTRMLSVLSPLTSADLANGQSAGMQIGTGDQDNYIKLAVAANDGGLDILVLHEENGLVSESFLPASIPIGAQVDLFFEVNPSAGTVTPAWQVNGGALETGPAITLDGGSSILSAIRGTYANGAEPSAMALGVIATHGDTGKPFSAQYDHINVYAGSLSEQATTTVVFAQSSTEPLSFDATDTFIFDDATSYSDINKLDLDSGLPPGIIKRGALPPGLDKDGGSLPPGLEGKASGTWPGKPGVELPASAASKLKTDAELATIPAAVPSQEVPALEAFEARVLELTNALRAEHGKPALLNDAALNDAAEDWSRRMAEEDFVAHSTPEQIEKMGYDWQAWGENIAAGHQTPESVVRAWAESPEHLANLLSDDFLETGIGYHSNPDDAGDINYVHYWTQAFATEEGWV